MKSWHLFGNPPADTPTPTSSSTCHQIADDTTTGSWRARALDQGNQVLDRDGRDADTDTDTDADADADEHGVSVPIDNNGSLVSDILYGANIEMVKIESVRAANAQGKHISGLVAVFVGGTAGIGASTARELFVRTTKPKAYIIGRSRDKGDKLVEDLRELNPEAEAIFLEKDISLIKNVDDVCEELLEKEDKINCLFLTAGYMTLKGRTETVEGMDRKMCVNYYSRIRWIQNLMPLLEAASTQNELSRVISVLAAGSEGDVRPDDLDLKRNFTLHACLAHCVVMTDFALEELAARHPGTSFSHSYPGTVKTGIVNELSGPVRLAVKVMYAVMTPWILNVQESGERHFFQMTNQCYPSRRGGVGIPRPEGVDVMRGSDGEIGSGAYLLDWDGKSIGDETLLRRYREQGLRRKVWEHTMAMFAQAERLNPRGRKRPASAEAEGSARPVPNPIGWRPG